MARWLRKNALIALMLLVTALAAGSLAVSVFLFEAQEGMAEEMLASYVSDLAETFAESAEAMGGISGVPGGRMMRGGMGHGHMMRGRIFYRMFSADPSIRSGGVLLLDRERRPIGGSEGAEALVSLWRDGLPLDGVSKAADASGAEYLVAARSLPGGNAILVAASGSNLLSGLVRLCNYWIAQVIAASLAMLVCAAALWRCLVIPMRRVVETIGVTRWGRERPDFGRPWLYEVRALTDVLGQSAEDAIAKEELRARYVGDIVQAQEDTRRRFSRELHDGPLQTVVASIKRVQLAQLAQNAQNADGGAKARARLDEAERISQAAADEIRNFCEELSPSWMALGLRDALDELAARLASAHGVRIDVQLDELDGICAAMTDECALALIRVTQEAVSNSARHGGASRIEVRLKSSVFTIADDGRGFGRFDQIPPSDHERLRVEGHRGLSNMHERAQLLGGSLEVLPRGIDGGPGVTIAVTLPAR